MMYVHSFILNLPLFDFLMTIPVDPGYKTARSPRSFALALLVFLYHNPYSDTRRIRNGIGLAGGHACCVVRGRDCGREEERR